MQNQLNTAESSRSQLEQDNIALYSKIRYLQSLSGTGTQGSGQGSGQGMGYGRPSPKVSLYLGKRGRGRERVCVHEREGEREIERDGIFQICSTEIQSTYLEYFVLSLDL